MDEKILEAFELLRRISKLSGENVERDFDERRLMYRDVLLAMEYLRK